MKFSFEMASVIAGASAEDLAVALNAVIVMALSRVDIPEEDREAIREAGASMVGFVADPRTRGRPTSGVESEWSDSQRRCVLALRRVMQARAEVGVQALAAEGTTWEELATAPDGADEGDMDEFANRASIAEAEAIERRPDLRTRDLMLQGFIRASEAVSHARVSWGDANAVETVASIECLVRADAVTLDEAVDEMLERISPNTRNTLWSQP